MPTAGEPTEGVEDGIREFLSQRDLVFALLYGSHARGTAEESSDVDIALRFPPESDETERFHRRNRIDAELQEYATGFVDVSDIDQLPTPVAHAALQDGIILVGDEQTVNEYQNQVETTYEAEASDREQQRREFIDRLARGDV